MGLQEQELIARHIEPNPHRSGPHEARLKEYGVSVWALVGYWKGTNGDVAEVAEAYDVPSEAVEAALAHYRRYKELIDARLLLNEAAFVEKHPRRWLTSTPTRMLPSTWLRCSVAAAIRLSGRTILAWSARETMNTSSWPPNAAGCS